MTAREPQDGQQAGARGGQGGQGSQPGEEERFRARVAGEPAKKMDLVGITGYVIHKTRVLEIAADAHQCRLGIGAQLCGLGAQRRKVQRMQRAHGFRLQRVQQVTDQVLIHQTSPMEGETLHDSCNFTSAAWSRDFTTLPVAFSGNASRISTVRGAL